MNIEEIVKGIILNRKLDCVQKSMCIYMAAFTNLTKPVIESICDVLKITENKAYGSIIKMHELGYLEFTKVGERKIVKILYDKITGIKQDEIELSELDISINEIIRMFHQAEFILPVKSYMRKLIAEWFEFFGIELGMEVIKEAIESTILYGKTDGIAYTKKIVENIKSKYHVIDDYENEIYELDTGEKND
jgi:hypothetical protein